ncbi:hypothetical protein D931_00561 [Enterococcus faecium 13.SD.W.09]|nr:hypothetical protein D931_00561 [Enterococcus faecium 13.SD.W.09]
MPSAFLAQVKNLLMTNQAIIGILKKGVSSNRKKGNNWIINN